MATTDRPTPSSRLWTEGLQLSIVMLLKLREYQLSISTIDDTVCVGVLPLYSGKETKTILNAVEDLGHEPVWLCRENAAISIEDGKVAVEPEVDVIASRLLPLNIEEPAELLGLATTFNRIRPMLNEPNVVLAVVCKFVTAATFANWDIQVPDALLALSNDRLDRDRERFDDVGACKPAISTHGDGTWEVGLVELVNPRVGSRQALLQRLVDRNNDRHRSLCVYVVDDGIVDVVYHYVPEDDWRANIAFSDDVLDVTDEMSDEARQTALYATEVMEMDHVGVDLVEGNGGWFVLRANPTTGFKGLYQTTDKSPVPHIMKPAIRRTGGEANETRVEELSATLGDSAFLCAPGESPIIDDKAPLVGYIEEVVINGASGFQQTLARSGTGAIWTSIDTSLAAEIGAGPIKSMTRVKSGNLKGGKARPVVDLVVGIGSTQHIVTASVEDHSHMGYPLLLGRDILERCRVDVHRRVNIDRNGSDDEEEELLEG